jgi:hypothetical protein
MWNWLTQTLLNSWFELIITLIRAKVNLISQTLAKSQLKESKVKLNLFVEI